MQDRLLWYEQCRLVIPKPLRLRILYEHHNTPIAGHPSWTLTYAQIALSFFWPHMSRDIRRYVRSCDECQRMKDDHHMPYGLAQPLSIPDRPWSSVSMDFISHLPLTVSGYDSITVFVDRYTKMVHLAPGHTTDTAKDVAAQFLSKVFSLHGMPLEIITDRGSVFTSAFWRTFLDNVGSRRRLPLLDGIRVQGIERERT